jgi:hypothetical protein
MTILELRPDGEIRVFDVAEGQPVVLPHRLLC